MKKTILSSSLALAIAGSFIIPTAVMAAPNLYGNVHLSLNLADNDITGNKNNLAVSSNTSAIGVKGSELVTESVKVIYKVEFQVNILGAASTDPDVDAPNESDGTIVGRDQFAGLKSALGVVKVGVISSSYKDNGERIDPLYRTPLEARGFLKMQSAELHGGRGINRGRQTNTLQYESPNMAGFKVIANGTFSGSSDETVGVGIRWQNKSWLAYADWVDSQTGNVVNDGKSVKACDVTSNCSVESAYKIGGSYQAKSFFIGLQYEAAEKRTGGDYLFGSAYYNFNKSNQIIATVGAYSANSEAVTAKTDADSLGYAVAYNHKLTKLTNAYVGYGGKSDDAPNADESMFTMGVRVKF